MQVDQFIVERVEVNMMNDLPLRRAGNLPVLPFAPASLAAVTEAAGVKRLAMMSVALLRRRGGWRRAGQARDRRDHLVSPTHVRAVGHARDLLPVGKECIAVTAKHLVVAHAQFLRGGGPIAMGAGAADNFAAPSVFSRTVPLDAFVVHQAHAMRGVLPSAPFNRADAVEFRRGHLIVSTNAFPRTIPYKALGNSMAVNCMRWLGTRIALVEAELSSIGRAAA